MKLSIGDTILKSVMVHTDSDDATLVASAMQAGISGYAGGQKIIGTGKAFAFATYGGFSSNGVMPIPVSEVNTVSISSATHSVKMTSAIVETREFGSTATIVAHVVVNDVDYPIAISVSNNTITLSCDQTLTLQVLFGKDEYI